MSSIKNSTIEALKAKGLTAESDVQEIKKAFFGITSTPLSKANLPIVLAALAGDLSQIITDEAAAPVAAAKTTKTAKTPKEPKPAKEPRAPKVAESGVDALARLKADPATADRWARVQEVLEMGKKGPTRIRIVCDDQGAEGETLYRDIKVQDLFQVKFSAGYKKPRAAKPKPEVAVAA